MFESLLKRLAAELSGREVPYMIIGGQAVLRYGEPRLTKDIDVTVGLHPRDAEPVLAAIQALRFEILVDDALDFLGKTFVLPTADSETGLRVDFVFSLSEYERGAIDRAQVVKLGEVEVRFISVEDLVIYKVVAGRPRDMEDARSVMLKNPSIDQDEIRRWLREYDKVLGEDFETRFLKILKEL